MGLIFNLDHTTLLIHLCEYSSDGPTFYFDFITNINWCCLFCDGILFYIFYLCMFSLVLFWVHSLLEVWTHGRTGLLFLHSTLFSLQLDESTVHAIHTWHLLLQLSSQQLMWPSTSMPCAKCHWCMHQFEFKDTTHIVKFKMIFHFHSHWLPSRVNHMWSKLMLNL